MFKKDDFVRTSKGKVGRITVPESISIGYNEGKDFVEVVNCEDIDIANSHLPNLVLVYNRQLEIKKKPNIVTLGTRQFPILGDNLEKMDTVGIVVQQGLSQHTFSLPIEDAKLFIDILQRNKIWYALR